MTTKQINIRSSAGLQMVAIAFLAQNCAIGLAYGVYGTLLEAIQAQYQSSRAVAASGLSVMSLVMGLLSPVVGTLCQRYSLRLVMTAGAVGNAIGYALLSIAPSIGMFLLIFAIIIGPSVCMLGIIPASTLVNNWFVKSRGKALGLVNTPVFLFIFPLVAAILLRTHGTATVFLMISGIFMLMIPLTLRIVSRPEDIGELPYGVDATTARPVAAPGSGPTGRAILSNPSFLLLCASIGLLTAGGIMMVTHLVPLARSRGLDLETGSLLLSTYGLSGAVGALLFGWLADRIGGTRALAAQALIWVGPWLLLLVVEGLPALLLLALLMGCCSGAIVGLAAATMGEWMGTQNFGRAMGYLYFIKIPFMFAAGPLAGFIFDRTGNYTAAILLHAATFALVGLIFLFYRPRRIFQ